MHFMHEGKDDWCLYFGEKQGAFFIGYNVLERGWKSSKIVKGGLQYWQPAFITGKVFTSKSKWYKLPTINVSSKLYYLLKGIKAES